MVLINENRWRAQRYGLDEGLIDPATGTIAPVDAILDALLPALAEDAAVFDCADELAHVRTILMRGTSADRQLALYSTAVERGLTREAALSEVVDQLIYETQQVRSAAPVAAPPQAIAEART